METKDPGYYRKLMESIETKLPVSKNQHRMMGVAQAIHRDLGQALQSRDPMEIKRLMENAYNGMEEVIASIHQGGLDEMGYGSRGPRRGDTVQAGVGTTLTRHAGTDDEEELDIWITFDARLVTPGGAATRTDPAYGHEWEFEIVSIDIDLPRGMKPPPGEELTPEEQARIEEWFKGPEGQARAEEAANDRYDPFEQGDY